MITATLYTRSECHLCDQAKADLESLQAAVPHRLIEIDVDANEELQKVYGDWVPVVEIGPYRLKPPFGVRELEMTLNAERDRQHQVRTVERADYTGVPENWTTADRFTLWFSNHYVAVLNVIVAIYLGGAILAPILMKAGLEPPANLLYRGYSLVCHQLAYRSIFLFGEQYVYPRESAHFGDFLSFAQATGLSESGSAEDLIAARTFAGNDTIGYKIALCQRDVAIYAGILIFGIVFALTKNRLPGLPWYLWILIGILPIAIDGFSQLFSQPPLDFIPFRESTPFWRLLTGFLFGFTTAWFGYPLVEDSMADTRRIMQRKLERNRGAQPSPASPTNTD